MKFDLRITLGNVLTIIGGIAVAAIWFFWAGAWSARVEDRLAKIETSVAGVECQLFAASIISTVSEPCYAHATTIPTRKKIDGSGVAR